MTKQTCVLCWHPDYDQPDGPEKAEGFAQGLQKSMNLQIAMGLLPKNDAELMGDYKFMVVQVEINGELLLVKKN
jgi:hypothetical protein